MSEQSQDTIDRNDPSIDPDGPMGSSNAPTGSTSDKPQAAEPDEKLKGNIYTPDYEPEEKPNIQRSNPQPVTGHKDGDIDTDGG